MLSASYHTGVALFQLALARGKDFEFAPLDPYAATFETFYVISSQRIRPVLASSIGQRLVEIDHDRRTVRVTYFVADTA